MATAAADSNVELTEGLVHSDSINRFNNIMKSLPTKTRLALSSLCLLDNVSTQLLRFLIYNANAPHVLAMLTDNTNYLASGESETFQILLQLFKQVRTIYNPRTPLLNVHDVAPGLWFPNEPPPRLLIGHEAFIITAIRKCNLLTFILTTLNCFQYGFDLLQKTFLDIFCPNTLYIGTSSQDQMGKFLKSQAILFLDLKTQALIAGLTNNSIDETGKIDHELLTILLDKIFPKNMQDTLLGRRGNGNGTLTPSEQDFVERCDRRRENLMQFNNFNDLVASYDWNHFIKELLDYCNKNMGLIIWGRKGRGKSPLYAFDSNEFETNVMLSSAAVSASYIPGGTGGPVPVSDVSTNSQDDPITVTTTNTTTNTNDDDSNENDSNRPSSIAANNALNNERAQAMAAMDGTTTGLNKNSSRMAQYIVNSAIASSGSRIKKIKSKRTWSKEEEAALVAGLEEVGPSWSKILDMHGPGGKISENLKNRTQVQLKDKARNWKLQYLKSGKPLPTYLLKVTGTLDKAVRGKKKNNTPSLAKSILESTEKNQNDVNTTNNDTSASPGTVASAAAAAAVAAIVSRVEDNNNNSVNTDNSTNNNNNDNNNIDNSKQTDTSRSNTQSQEPDGDLFENSASEANDFDSGLENGM